MSVLKLKDIMGLKGITRDELAKRVGVSVTTITNITSEKNLPTIQLLLKIAESLDCDIRELFVPTRGNSVTQDEINAAKSLISKGLEILQGK